MDSGSAIHPIGVVIGVTGFVLMAWSLINYLEAGALEARIRRAEFCRGKVVTEVGGCDQYGRCGVRLNTGEFITMSRPVVGKGCEY